MESIIVIPARMSATRFPGKPLVKIAGISMIGHCYLRAKMAKLANHVYVATCDDEIANEINRLGGKVVMTSHHHERASDRVAEALSKIELDLGKVVDIIVMLQGDEPLVHPDCLDELIHQHRQFPAVSVFNLTQYIQDESDFYSVNTVKILTNLEGDILIFTREPVPSTKLKGLGSYQPKKQLGVIAFKRNTLIDFYHLPSTPLEKIESIDMLRLIENGKSIREVMTKVAMLGVDTLEDAKKVETMIVKDDFYHAYKMIYTL